MNAVVTPLPSKVENHASGIGAQEFAEAARVIGRILQAKGWLAPGYRTPPRVVGCDRSIRRSGNGGATIAVRVRNRPAPAVFADMIDGAVAANRLAGADAVRCRAALWAELASMSNVVKAAA